MRNGIFEVDLLVTINTTTHICYRRIRHLLRGVAALLVLVHSRSVAADRTLKDHVSAADVWNGRPVSEQVYSPFDTNIRQVAASAFTGDGGYLQRVSGIFAVAGADGLPDTAELSDFAFRFVFYLDTPSFSTDPYADNVSGGNVLYHFSTPSNSDWQVAIGSSPSLEVTPFSLYYWEFDVAPLRIQTIPGQQHLASIIGEPLSVNAGTTLIALSNGSAGSVGNEIDWGQSNLFGLSADTLPNLGAPFDQIAFKVTSQILPATVGDYDADGDSDGVDFLTWQRSLGQSGLPVCSGADGNCDGIINAADLAIWGIHAGATSSGFMSRATNSIPEPSSSCLLAAALVIASLRNVFNDRTI